jgi:hypothetical protein
MKFKIIALAALCSVGTLSVGIAQAVQVAPPRAQFWVYGAPCDPGDMSSGGFCISRSSIHGSGAAPPTSCNGATNDLVYSNICSGVYYRTIQQP